MDVFLIPIDRDGYDLYCEPPPAARGHEAAGRPSLTTRVREWFRRVVAEGEAVLRRDPQATAQHGRLRRAVTAKLAEAVAEQRLLWHLRLQTSASLVHPDDLDADRALEFARARLARDGTRHLRWCVIDTAIGLVTIPIALLPGPNLIGYYFAFRAIGHFLSVRGARRGRHVIRWQCRATPHLTSLRAALASPRHERGRQVDVIARALGLDRLGAFLDKTAARR